MLKKFAVTNFKNFKNKVVLDLGNPASYEFNGEIVYNGCITKGILYGINGSGKSNLALAIFDIVTHLTDKEKSYDKYRIYLNLDSAKKYAEFYYLFDFNGVLVEYEYSKNESQDLISETLKIDNKEVIIFDYDKGEGAIYLKGAETLQKAAAFYGEDKRLSRVKFTANNSILDSNVENETFTAFIEFVNKMLMFYSLTENRYQGFTVGSESYTRGIINSGKVDYFQKFLYENEIDYNLVVKKNNGQPELYCKFNRGSVPFSELASTGTKSLALFYYWYIKMREASFVYIDEYDAFYHYALSRKLVELLRNMTETQIVFSTHNTDLISNDLLRPDAYFILNNNKINSFDKLTDKELRRAHNLQKMYKAGSFYE